MPKFKVYLVGRQPVFATIEVERDSRPIGDDLSEAELAEVQWQPDYEKIVDDIDVVYATEAEDA